MVSLFQLYYRSQPRRQLAHELIPAKVVVASFGSDVKQESLKSLNIDGLITDIEWGTRDIHINYAHRQCT